MEEIKLNEHNKNEYAPMHTCEHILNRTMQEMFGCPRSRNTHIERKKSKADYILSQSPTEEDVKAIEKSVNEIISRNITVTEEFVSIEEAADMVDLFKLPENVSETIRIVSVGDFDKCACIGDHVNNTSEIGTFVITSHSFSDNTWRVRFKLIEK